jgi:ABC-type Fe3+/spermidine/putrescine transport system ATPase subunit
MSVLSIEGAVKTFGANTVVKGFDLSVAKGEFVSFVGPSGCGKTTVLRMIAGFERPTSGRIIIDGRDVTDLAPNRRRIGMVFQAYALFPNMNVSGNIAFGLKIVGLSKAETEARVQEMLGLISLSHLAARYPYELSGGQQQLVSIMRSLAVHPEVLFLDEPFSALDYEMTLFMRDKLQDIFEATKTTMILVSHDLDEAVYLADQVLMLTRRPTRIAEVVRFDAPRPRHPETLTSDAFIRAKAQCLEVFQREVRVRES